MRRIPLKTLPLAGPGGERLPDLVYGQALILLAKGATGGLTSDELELALDIEATIGAATGSAGGDSVVLGEEQWLFLLERLRQNRWPFAAAAFREMILDVKGARREPGLAAAD